jgi:hypothetical protein
MAKRHVTRVRIRPPHEFANEGEVAENDEPLLPSATGREEGTSEDEQDDDLLDEVRAHDPGGKPQSEITGQHEPGTGDETEDGLDALEEEVRREAENWPGRREKL